MSEPRDRIFPRVPLTRDDWHAFCHHWGLVQRAVFEPTDENPSYEESWSNEEKTFGMSFCDDAIACLAYVTMRGVDDEGYVDDFVFSFGSVEVNDMLQMAMDEHPPDLHIANAFLMSIAFLEYDERAAAALRRYALEGEHPTLRRAALEAIARGAWSPCRAIVSSAAEHDPDEAVRAQARSVLERWPA